MIDDFINALAQLETAGGKKTIKGPNGEDSYNLFNIKDNSGNGFRALDKAEGSRDAYRVYSSPDEAKEDLKDLLARKYPKALDAKSPVEFATALKQGGYATDPLYVAKFAKVASSVDPLSSLRSAGWGADIDFALKQGFTPQEIAARIKAAPAPAQPPRGGGQQVAEIGARGGDAAAQLDQLYSNGWKADIDYALDQGFKPEEIVSKIAGPDAARGKAAYQKQAQTGALSNFASSAVDAVADLGHGASQMYSEVTGDKAGAARKYAEEQARRSNLDNIASESTTSGAIGRAAPMLAATVGAAAATGGGSLLAQAGAMGAVGAVGGALRPQVEEGHRLETAGTEGALGAVGGAAGGLLARAPGLALRGLQNTARGGRSVAEIEATQAAREAAGIQSSAADLSPRLAATADKISDSVIGSKWLGADMRAAREPEIAKAITSRIGNPADELSAGVVKKAQENVSKLYDDALDGVHVDLPPTFAATMDTIVADHSASTIPSLASNLPKNVAADLKELAGNGPVSARQLQSIRSKIGAEMSSGSDPAAKASLGQIRDAVDDAIRSNLPAENLAKFAKANEYYKNLQVVENYGRRTNWSGDDFNAKRFMTSIKAENRAGFERGDAPFQDLVGAIAEGQGAAAGRGGINPLQLANLAGAYHTGGTSLLGSGVAGNLALRILTDPKYANVLLGLNPVQRAGLMQAAAAARAGGAAVGAEAVARPQPTAQVLPFRKVA